MRHVGNGRPQADGRQRQGCADSPARRDGMQQQRGQAVATDGGSRQDLSRRLRSRQAAGSDGDKQARRKRQAADGRQCERWRTQPAGATNAAGSPTHRRQTRHATSRQRLDDSSGRAVTSRSGQGYSNDKATTAATTSGNRQDRDGSQADSSRQNSGGSTTRQRQAPRTRWTRDVAEMAWNGTGRDVQRLRRAGVRQGLGQQRRTRRTRTTTGRGQSPNQTNRATPGKESTQPCSWGPKPQAPRTKPRWVRRNRTVGGLGGSAPQHDPKRAGERSPRALAGRVEVPGIEPGSSVASSRLLRAQFTVSLLGPADHVN